MRMAFGIVSLVAKEWRQYKELRLRALEKEPGAFSSTYAEVSADPDIKWPQRLQRAIDVEDWLLFARLDGNLVGMIGAFQDEEEKQNKIAHVYGMYVDAEARRQGIGRALMARLLEDLRDRNIVTARLGVNADQQPAKKLYENFGFATVGGQLWTMGDGQEHQVLAMELAIK
jgi:ribosomal protein S18 acetylase RimI-like enzyme